MLTVIGIVLSEFGLIENGKLSITKAPFFIIGILLVLYGVNIWWRAVLKTKVDDYINSNKLCTSGVYAIVRNPCYSAIMMVCTGTLLIANNIWLLLLPIVYWIFMTVLMKNTEEKWLIELYGQQYLNYCKKVNRCIPWFKR